MDLTNIQMKVRQAAERPQQDLSFKAGFWSNAQQGSIVSLAPTSKAAQMVLTPQKDQLIAIHVQLDISALVEL